MVLGRDPVKTRSRGGSATNNDLGKVKPKKRRNKMIRIKRIQGIRRHQNVL